MTKNKRIIIPDLKAIEAKSVDYTIVRDQKYVKLKEEADARIKQSRSEEASAWNNAKNYRSNCFTIDNESSTLKTAKSFYLTPMLPTRYSRKERERIKQEEAKILRSESITNEKQLLPTRYSRKERERIKREEAKILRSESALDEEKQSKEVYENSVENAENFLNNGMHKEADENKNINYLATNISINGKAFLNGNPDVIDLNAFQKRKK